MKRIFLVLSFCFIALKVKAFPEIPSFEKVRSSYQSSELFLLDRQGRPLHQWRQSYAERSLSWISINEVSSAMKEAVLKSEDQKFYSHAGVDINALAASLYQRLFKKSSRGGSTISMQVVKLLSNDKTYYQGWIGKFRQLWMAGRLEEQWNKDQILEAYLNLVPFRGEYKGLAAASWAFFDKMPSGLTLKESTLLSVLIRAPNASLKDWTQRACWQEPKMCSEFADYLSGKTFQISLESKNQAALHLAQRLRRSGVRGELRTSVDKDLQVYVQELITSQIQSLEGRNVHDAAGLVIENDTGQVWAYVGGSAAFSTSPYVDGVQSLRQAGSTLKPFLYATAFEKNILRPESWIEDSAVDIVFDRGIYKPQNHDRQFYGWVQAKTALGSSLNVPAVKVFKLLNDESFWSKLQQLQFRRLAGADHYGPALALGVADVTLEDLTQAYRTLARSGVYSPLRFDLSNEVQNEDRIFAEKSVHDITDILADSENRSLGFGLDSTLSISGVAVKTGTSKDMRDNWCLGYNSRFTVGVWVGNFSGEPMWNVMGVTGAAPIWKQIFEWLQEKYPGTELKLGQIAGAPVGKPVRYPQARIRYPQDGTIVAIDPGIPASQQKIPLIVDSDSLKGLYWKVNGGKKISASRSFLWTPQKGRHSFSLYKDEDLKERIHILVK